MKNTKETSLQVVHKKGIFGRVIDFFKGILYKPQYNNTQLSELQNSSEEKRNSFAEAIKFEQDPDREKLLNIQDEIEKRGINRKNVIELTKDLSDLQKQKLVALYKEQINALETSIKSYKNKIIAIKGKI